MRSFAECRTTESGTEIFREEEGKSFGLRHNEYEIVCDIIAMDGCVFNTNGDGKRCDFLFLLDRRKQHYNYLPAAYSPAYYVELKGIALVKACEQLLNSIEKTSDQIPEFDLNAIVVSSRAFVPKNDNNEYYREVKRIIRKNIQFEITPFTISL